MSGFAVCVFLKRFGWSRVGIIAQGQTDIIWLLTRKGLHYAMDARDVTSAMSTLWTPDMDIEDVLVETAAVSRSMSEIQTTSIQIS